MNQQMKLTRLTSMIFCAVLWGTTLSAQDDKDKLTYSAPSVYFVLTDIDGKKELHRTPIGKNGMIYYDKFFKSYSIYADGDDGKLFNIELKSAALMGSSIPNMVRVKDETGSYFYVVDQLSTIGRLKILSERPRDGMLAWFYIEKATPFVNKQ